MTDNWKDTDTSGTPEQEEDSLRFPHVSFDASSQGESPAQEPASPFAEGEPQPFAENAEEASPSSTPNSEEEPQTFAENPVEASSSAQKPGEEPQPFPQSQAEEKSEEGPAAESDSGSRAPEDVYSYSRPPQTGSQDEAFHRPPNPYARPNGYPSGNGYYPGSGYSGGNGYYSGNSYNNGNNYRPNNGYSSNFGGGFPPQPPVYSPTSGWQEPAPVEPPRKAGRRQKLFLGLIGALAVVLAVSFVGWGIWSASFGDPDNPPFAELPSTSSSPSDSAPSSGENSQQETPSASEQPEISLGEGGDIDIQSIPSGDPMTAKDVYKKVAPSVVGIVATITDANGNETSDEGSGIVATSDGYIITNSHVVNDSRSTTVKVVTKDDEEYPGVVVGYDRTTDLAVIKIEATNLTPAEFGNADQMEIGDVVLAIGNPGGLDFASSMTQGIISALDRSLGTNSQNGMTYIQTDAAINPGNSGGALVNLYGQVIGINSSKLVAEDFEGMGFAIPVNKAKDILNSLMNVGYVQGRTRLGITGRDITEQEAQFYEVPAGFLILEIDEDSDIDEAGGQVQDIICGVNGQEVTGLSDISDLLLDYSPGDKITLTLYRMSGGTQGTGDTFDITITLLEDKGETQN